MHSKLSHYPLALAAGLLLALSLPAHAQTSRDGSAADAGIRAQLTALEYDYEVDDDNDFKLVFSVGDADRSQIVFVRSAVETYGSHAVREIWSPGYTSPDGEFPAPVANRLLAASSDAKLGGWVKQGRNAVFVVKIAADAGQQQLDDAIEAAITLGDEMEAELTPGQDAL